MGAAVAGSVSDSLQHRPSTLRVAVVATRPKCLAGPPATAAAGAAASLWALLLAWG